MFFGKIFIVLLLLGIFFHLLVIIIFKKEGLSRKELLLGLIKKHGVAWWITRPEEGVTEKGKKYLNFIYIYYVLFLIFVIFFIDQAFS